MINWIQIRGIVKQGYGVASGKSQDPRFPHGTIAMQKPFFRERGFDLDGYFTGTINISIAPHQYQIKKAKHTFKNIKWASEVPAEDFSFFDCRILLNTGKLLDGFIYYPHPETKPEHFQTPDTLEIITSFIGNLQYGDELIVEVDRKQIYLLDFSRKHCINL